MPKDFFRVSEAAQAGLRDVGAQLKAARELRALTIAEVAAALQTSPGRVRRAEAGNPAVSMGIYAMLLDHYGLVRDLGALAWPITDPIAKARHKLESQRTRPTRSPA